MKENKFDPKELANSKRIFKSATPKYTFDWYIKWVASAFVLSAMSIRGIEGYAFTDVVLSMIGILLWLIVSIIWNDRALILLNGLGLGLLLRTFAQSI
jgi:fatty-acid desaturase